MLLNTEHPMKRKHSLISGIPQGRSAMWLFSLLLSSLNSPTPFPVCPTSSLRGSPWALSHLAFCLIVGLGQSESPVEDWKVGREKSGLFFSTPSISGLCFLVMRVSSITTVLVGQPLSITSSQCYSKVLCPPCYSVSLGASDASLWLIFASSSSISGFINLSHIFANVLLGLLCHLSTSLCLLALLL